MSYKNVFVSLKAMMQVMAFFILSLAISTAFGATDVASSQPSKFVLCKNHGQVRSIRVVVADETSNCRAFYTKSGSDRVVGTGQRPENCDRFVDNIKSNLEDASWQCRSVAQAMILRPQPATENAASSDSLIE